MAGQIIGLTTGREEEWQQSIGVNQYNAVAVDAGGGTGATITSGMTTQATGYQIQAGITIFTTVTPGVTGNGNTPTAACVLPLSSNVLKNLQGATVYIINNGANPINCYPNSGDSNNSINGQATNLPVVLGANTITPFLCSTNGIWTADGVGEGASGSIATTVSQGNVTAATGGQGSATPITQALANVTTTASGGGVVLPPAKAGMQINVANNGANSLQVYGNGSDTINGTAGSTGVALTAGASFTIFVCFMNGAWLTK
jgi:hypothetical protein